MQRCCYGVIPFFIITLTLFINLIPFGIRNISILTPLITYGVIYFFTIRRPEALPYIVILIAGLFNDILESNVLGISSLCFLLFQMIINSQKKYIINNTFFMMWGGFVFCLSIILLITLLLSKFIFHISYLPLYIVSMEWIISIFLYVPTHWLLNKVKYSSEIIKL